MTGPIHAHVRRVLTGPEGRALVHAVDDAGLEYKIEVPIEAVRGVSLDQSHVLVVSWALQASPRVVGPATVLTPSASTTSSTPSAVDQAFMELMGRPHSSTLASAVSAAASPNSSPTTARNASQGLAELLGAKRP